LPQIADNEENKTHRRLDRERSVLALIGQSKLAKTLVLKRF
jgi:hypothetical protein